MSTFFTASRLPRPSCRAVAILGSLLFLVTLAPASRAQSPAGGPPASSVLEGPAVDDGPLPSAPPSIVMASAWKSFWTFLDSTLNNRRRMLQFATLGMCLALYIMIWRR